MDSLNGAGIYSDLGLIRREPAILHGNDQRPRAVYVPDPGFDWTGGDIFPPDVER
jgi:hypothetical protein